MGAPIVDVRHLRAEAANINWKLSRKISGFTAQLVQQRQHFLCFAKREHGYEDACAPIKRAFERLRESSLFAGSRPTRRLGMIASCAFHDEDVNFLFRKNGGLHDRLVVD